MKIEDIFEEWKKDSQIDNTDLDVESLKIPYLHSKWLKIMSEERQRHKGFQAKKQQLNKLLHEYYSGDLNNPDDLKQINRTPFLKKVLKSDMATYIETDSEMIDLNLKLLHQLEKVEICEEIMKALNNRNWNIRNAIEWRRLTNFGT